MSSLSRKRVLSSCMRGDGVLVEVLRRARALARLSSVGLWLPFIATASRAVQWRVAVSLLQDI